MVGWNLFYSPPNECDEYLVYKRNKLGWSLFGACITYAITRAPAIARRLREGSY